MEAEEAGNTIEEAAADSPQAASRFRLSPRALLMTGVGAVLVLGIVAGGWAYFANRARQVEVVRVETAERARVEAEWHAAANSAENQEQLAAARKAHAEIMSADTAVPLVVAPPVPMPEGPAAPAEAPASPVDPAPAPAKAKTALSPPPVESPPPRPKLRPIQEPPASVANDPAPQRPGDCAVSGGGAKDFGAALGRCLEVFNGAEAGGAEPSAANAVPARPARR